MHTRPTLHQLADDLIREARKPFSSDDFISNLQSRWHRKIALSTLEKFKRDLTDHNHLIEISAQDYLPYRAVLEKIGHIPLSVTIRNLELEEKILIPGDRLIPYVSHDLNFEDLTLIGPDGKEIPKQKKTLYLEKAIDYFLYSSEHHFPDFIKINESMPGKSTFTLSVWDMSGVYRALKIKTGDALLLKLVDFDRGVFEVFPYPRGAQRKNKLKQRALCLALEEHIDRLNEKKDFSSSSLEKQLLRAFYNLDASLLEVADFSLSQLLDSTDKLSVVGVERGYPRFVREGKFENLEYTCEEPPHTPKGLSNSLAEILEDLAMPFNDEEFKAILITALGPEKYKLDTLVDLLFGGKGDLFCNKKQEKAFYRYLEKLIKKLYLDMEQPESKVIAELRRKTVILKLSLIKLAKVLKEYQINLADLPWEMLDQIADLDSFCGETLNKLADRNVYPDLGTIREIRLAHKIVFPQLAILEEEIYAQLGVY